MDGQRGRWRRELRWPQGQGPGSAGRCLVAGLALAAAGSAGAAQDLIGLSLEQLLNVEITVVAKYRQRADEASSAVTVIGADEIRSFGYRTLSEVLRSVRGFYFSNDRTYDYIGVRGFAPPGDYNNRVLLLIDGYRLNDSVYDQGLYDSGFPLDLDLVERIEIARGPGSSAFGANALFGVVNVVTRRAADIGSLELAAEAASFRSAGLRASAGLRLDNGAEFLLSASGFRSPGPNLHFPEFDQPGGPEGRIDGADFDRNERLFARLDMGPLTVTAGRVSRSRGNAASAFGVDFNDARNAIRDDQEFLDLKLETRLGEASQATTRVFAGNHYYHGSYIYGPPPVVVNPDAAYGAWWGAEARLMRRLSEAQTVLVGGEYQHNSRQDQWWDYPDPAAPDAFESRHRSERLGFFAQTSYRWSEQLLLDAGLRFDKSSGRQGQFSPRLGVVLHTSPGGVLKLLYGTAFRAPNVYESFYAFPAEQIGNADLRAERIRTYEALYEHYLSPRWRLTGAGYHYRIADLIAQVPVSVIDPLSGLPVDVLQFRNQPRVTGRGLEAELDGLWGEGARLRASYAYQLSRDAAGQELLNSPRHLLKFNGSVPLGWMRLRMGLEIQASSRRKTWNGHVPGLALANLTLLRPGDAGAWELSAGVFNLFNRRHDDPASQDFGLIGRGIVRARIPQEGRSLRLKASYRF